MKSIIALLLFFPTLLCAAPVDYEGRFLNHTILTLPAKYFADIPLEDRSEMLTVLNTEIDDGRLDYRNHCLYWNRESERKQGSVKASCNLAVKLLPRVGDRVIQNPFPPFVFVSMDRAEAFNAAPMQNQAFVLRWRRGEWIDISAEQLPSEVDRKKHFRVKREFHGIEVADYREGSNFQQTSKAQLLVWQNEKFTLREPFPVPTDCTTDIPFDPGELAALALTPERDSRRLMWLIIYAGLERDERFRYLLKSEELKKDESVALALASYEYALDKNEASLDFIIDVMEREGGGDTDSLLVISYMDEWLRTTEILLSWKGDGAVGEAMYMLDRIREYLFPENYRKHNDRAERR